MPSFKGANLKSNEIFIFLSSISSNYTKGNFFSNAVCSMRENLIKLIEHVCYSRAIIFSIKPNFSHIL